MPDTPEETALFEAGRDYVQSLDRGLAVMRALGRLARPATLSETAAASGLSRAVTRRLLLTLAHLGYVRQDGRAFGLTARVLELGFGYLGALALPEIARGEMEALSRRIGESCSMGVLENDDVIYVQRVSVSRLMSIALAVGSRLPAWCTSMGRVMLGQLTDAELERRLASANITRITPHTCTDPGELSRRIRQARADGYAYVEQEMERGLCSVAVPLRDRDGVIVAALNVPMAYRENARGRALAELLPALREAASAIERLASGQLPPVPAANRGVATARRG